MPTVWIRTSFQIRPCNSFVKARKRVIHGTMDNKVTLRRVTQALGVEWKYAKITHESGTVTMPIYWIFPQNILVGRSAPAISSAYPNDHTEHARANMTSAIAPLVEARRCHTYTATKPAIMDETMRGRMYGVYWNCTGWTPLTAPIAWWVFDPITLCHLIILQLCKLRVNSFLLQFQRYLNLYNPLFFRWSISPAFNRTLTIEKHYLV